MSLRRPPSNVVAYDDFYSRDPAIIPPPADPKDREERDRKLAVARETGDWSEIVVPGATPARFKMLPLKGNVYREICDSLESKRVGSRRMFQVAFRCAIQGVVDPGLDVTIKTEDTERFGKVATADVADYFDRIDIGIVDELGNEAMRRARDLSPK